MASNRPRKPKQRKTGIAPAKIKSIRKAKPYQEPKPPPKIQKPRYVRKPKEVIQPEVEYIDTPVEERYSSGIQTITPIRTVTPVGIVKIASSGDY